MMLAVIASTLLAFADPVTVTVEDLKFNAAEFQKLKPSAEIHVMEQGRDVTYKGIPLRQLLVNQHLVDAEANAMGSLRGLSDAVILVKASDDYQATVSAAAAAMDVKGTRYLLATERDGKPLSEGQGPVKLIIPADPQHARWVRMVSGAELVRMPKSKAPLPKPPGR